MIKKSVNMKNISVCLVGDSKTGKTSFINYLLDNKFNNFSETTIGVTCYNLSFKKEKIFWKVYDTSGYSDYITITRQYLKSKDFYLLFFDLGNRYTFDNLECWINLIQNKTNILLVGNKCELFNQVSELEISKICSKYNLKYVEISVKVNLNINDVVSFVNDFTKHNLENKIFSDYDYLKLEEENPVEKCCGCIIL
jgi:small GTP-binding protein